MDKTTETFDQQLLDPGQLSLPERAATIDDKHGSVNKTVRHALQHWIALGHELIEAKTQVREELGPRKWLTWLEENTEVSPRTAQMAMKFASYEDELLERLKEEKRNVAHLSIRPAERIIKSIAQEQNGGGGNGADSDGQDGDGGADENDSDAEQPHGEGANEPDEDADGSDDIDSDDDGDRGGGEDEGDPDAKHFEALREAYEDADEPARDAFHKHLKDIYGLEVRPATKGSEQPDGEPAAAA